MHSLKSPYQIFISEDLVWLRTDCLSDRQSDRRTLQLSETEKCLWLLSLGVVTILGGYILILDNIAESFWLLLVLFGFLKILACVAIVHLRITEISSTFQRNETKYEVVYRMSQSANRIRKYFRTINGDRWQMICNKENCCLICA